MRQVNKFSLVCAVVAVILSVPATAAENSTKVEQHTRTYSVGLGKTRIIYSPSTSGSVISVSNSNEFPVLVQSSVKSVNEKDGEAPFVVTPPLFRLDPKQQSRLRVVMTQDVKVKDKESLYWLCAMGIPPEQSDVWAEGSAPAKSANTASLNISVRMSQCIKLILRPEAVKGQPQDVASAVTWQREGDKLMASNPTPFYMNLRTLSVGGKDVPDANFIPPMSSRTFEVPHGVSGKVSWTIVNDLGGDSGPYEANAR
ncbi:fimbria/pilus periplasmic chaperone [Serratia fonticola]|uniref:fimbria/pilus periplasmic chaperone n=1 Tax=Serratia fonticola TaxID=47917 RepID=UPI002DB833E1|nr:fimbria/pilus periplasmic chaperone [Serratia fonticola]MEB7884013.1 fimbria/pilus periplasmic chaperone [Serratia fonticola]